MARAVGLAAFVLVIFGVLAQAILLNVVNVNWDEFFFLSQIHEHLRGSLALPFQTIHVHFFSWLPAVSANEVDQVVAGRRVYLLVGIASCGLLYSLSRAFFDWPAAVLVVFSYVACGNIVAHWTSFRTDGFATMLFLGAARLLVWTSMGLARPLASGCLTGLMLLVTVKGIFFLPVALGLLFALPPGSPTRTKVRGAALWAGATSVTFLLLLLLHRSTLLREAAVSPSRFASDSWQRFLVTPPLFPRMSHFWSSIEHDFVIWACIAAGAAVLARRSLRDDRKPLWFLLPLACLVVYRNAYPYFYVFLMAPTVVAAGALFQFMLDRQRSQAKWAWVLPIITAALALSLLNSLWKLKDSRLDGQRELVAVVHDLFPEPVPYIDRNSMIASYPKVGFFMSTLGLQDYHRTGSPHFEELIRRHRPVFLIANHPVLDLNGPGLRMLRPADAEALQRNFIDHWGPLFVAGKLLDAMESTAQAPILIPGVYTVESALPLVINGRDYAPFDLVELPAGTVTFHSPSGHQRVALRWGPHLRRPTFLPPRGPIYSGF